MPNVAEGRATADRPVDAVTMACPVLTIVGDTDEEQERWRQAARFQLAFYGSTRTYRGVFEIHGWEGTSESCTSTRRRATCPRMAAVITDEMLDVLAVTSTWDGLAPALLDRYAGVEHPVRIICYFAGNSLRADDTFDQWQQVATTVRAG